MKIADRIETTMSAVIAQGQGGLAPPKLAAALNYAVTPGGARIRPTILMSVAMACGDDQPRLTNAAAVALELVHCASLVHDDLPCFDDADMRRGKPALHRAFSEPLAVLAGDSLIIMGFHVLARAAVDAPLRAIGLLDILGTRTGMPFGICAGQGWESESQIDLSAYHQAKPVPCSSPQPRWVPWLQDKRPNRGPNLVPVWARRFRSQMTCAMRFVMKLR